MTEPGPVERNGAVALRGPINDAADQYVFQPRAVAVHEDDGAAVPAFDVMQPSPRRSYKAPFWWIVRFGALCLPVHDDGRTRSCQGRKH